MATPAELAELERGDGTWENIQVAALCEDAMVGIRGKEEEAYQRVEARLQFLERQLQDRLPQASDAQATDYASLERVNKAERRLELLEEEMGHVVVAIDRKADMETILTQAKAMQDALRKRRLEHQREELEKRLVAAISALKAEQETLFRSDMNAWALENQENAMQSEQVLLERALRQQEDALRAKDEEWKRCQQTQQYQLDTLREEIEGDVRLILTAGRGDIARDCSEAHNRIAFEQQKLREETEKVSSIAEKTAAEVAAALEAFESRVLDREQEMQRQATGETQRLLEDALQAQEAAKIREQRKWKQQQHLVTRKLAELDQMLQLIGRQLIQNTSQLQVVRNEQLVRNVQLDDDEFLLPYDADTDAEALAAVSQTPSLCQQHEEEHEAKETEQLTATLAEEDAARRSQHQKLQDELDKKLRDYRQVLEEAKPPQLQTE
ncbi:hypothetical protein BBJ28_00002312 [Nothophytophthora sp. Chile5]|nr:hypothetical protein BBJ28_00002312 [Nothophytophthora sp. Chile5]